MRNVFSVLRRLLVVGFVAGMVAGCKTELYSSLPEREANEIVSVLGQSGIDASREKVKGGTFTVSVDRGEQARAIALLNQRGLPRQQFDSLGNIFDAKKVVSTPFEERARFMHAINQELAHSLTQISGVVSARVHVMLPETSPLERNRQTPRASVFVYHQPGANVSQYVPVIKNLVVNSVNGLNYEDVAVAMFPASGGQAMQGLSLAGLPLGNHAVLILLGGFLLGMLLFRRAIGRAVNQVLARS